MYVNLASWFIVGECGWFSLLALEMVSGSYPRKYLVAIEFKLKVCEMLAA